MIKYAIINCKLDNDKTYQNLIEQKVNKDDIQIYKYDGSKTIAALKNQAIDDTKGYSYLFIIENDLLIKVDVFRRYIDLMNDYKLGIVFYGYYGYINRVLHNLPNPSISVIMSEFHQQQIVRSPSDTFIGIDMGKNTQKFDEKFKVMEFNEFLKRCCEYKVLPFKGFYFDINNSWEYFDYTEGQPQPKRSITKETLISDKKYVEDNKEKLTLNFDHDTTKILEYIKQIGI